MCHPCHDLCESHNHNPEFLILKRDAFLQLSLHCLLLLKQNLMGLAAFLSLLLTNALTALLLDIFFLGVLSITPAVISARAKKFHLKIKLLHLLCEPYLE